MFLRHIRLRNVRSIAELEVDFDDFHDAGKTRKWTMLLGENGVGKSTILKAIALVTAGGDAVADLIGDTPDSWIRNGSDRAEIYARIETAEGAAREVSMLLNRGASVRDVYSTNSAALDELDSALVHSKRSYFVLGYGVNRRLATSSSSRLIEGKFRGRAANVGSLFDADAVLVPLETWAMDLDYRKGNALKVIKDVVEKLLPGMSVSHIDKSNRRLVFSTQDGEIPLAMLSDGYQNMAAWCGDLVFRITETFQDRRDPLTARGLLLIDELDLHLHPVWQRNLVEFLSKTFPRMQIIATTHSALTVHQARQGELFVLRRAAIGFPPEVVPFQGDPSKLTIQQLIVSPFVGLETADSVRIERLRQEARDLRLSMEQSSANANLDSMKNRLAEIQSELDLLPSMDSEPPYIREQNELLKRVRSELQGER